MLLPSEIPCPAVAEPGSWERAGSVSLLKGAVLPGWCPNYPKCCTEGGEILQNLYWFSARDSSSPLKII